MLNRRHTVAGAAAPQPAPTLFELRAYKALPGARDTLIKMFEGHFLDAYQGAGAAILGSFVNLDDPDRWVWIRAFAGPEARAAALQGFYTNAIWRDMRARANATIRDVSDATLLRPVVSERAPLAAPRLGAPLPSSVIDCTRYSPKSQQASMRLCLSLDDADPHTAHLGGRKVWLLETTEAENLYPRQPLRRDRTIVAMTWFESVRAHDAFRAAQACRPEWRTWRAACEEHLLRPIETWRLRPTARSALR